MRTGTKSVLFGYHQFLLHPVMLALAWWKLHGFRPVYIGNRRVRDGYIEQNDGRRYPCHRPEPEYASLWRPALWVAFIVHDIGYWGKVNMDDAAGEQHPLVGADIMLALFGQPWHDFTLYHSRFMARQHRAQFSALCVADKLAIALYPAWLYLRLTSWTGELHEYMSDDKYKDGRTPDMNPREWFANTCRYVRAWVAEHKDGRPDTWTWGVDRPASGAPHLQVLP